MHRAEGQCGKLLTPCDFAHSALGRPQSLDFDAPSGQLPLVRPIALLALAFLMPAVAAGQLSVDPHEARVGTDLARFFRARALLAEGEGPWTLDSVRRTWGGTLGLTDLRSGFNSDLPTTQRDNGHAWEGGGSFVRLSGSATWTAGPVRARLAPVLWWSQNADVLLVPVSTSNPFANPMRPSSIDLPQQFGTGSLGRLDPGESELVAEWRFFRAAATTAARRIGPGVDHALMLQGDGGGFPRIELGAPDKGIATPIGRVFGTLASGRLAESSQSPSNRTSLRHGSFVEARWRPFASGVLELGGSRFYHRDWRGYRVKDFLVPFGSFFFDEQRFGGGEADNQMANLFGRVVIPGAGIEVYAEYGKNDRSVDQRDLLLETDHNSAWLAGMQRSWLDAAGRLWSLNAVVAGARLPEFAPQRAQTTYYEHSRIRQGHTLRGQLLGTPLLQGTGGAEFRIDRYDATGRRGLVVHSRSLPNRRPIPVAAVYLRTEWGLMAEYLRNTRHGAVYTRVGGLADIGRHPTAGDVYSLHVSVGYILTPWARP
jgi:hypothetical protein